MDGKMIECQFHAVAYKYTGRFDQYAKLVGEAFQELRAKLHQIPSRTDTTVALYEPQRGSDHAEGFFYVGVVVSGKPEQLPAGSEYLYVKGNYASAIGRIKDMGNIYDFLGRWIRENGCRPIWPDALFIERYEFPIPEGQLTLEEEVEVLLPIVELSPGKKRTDTASRVIQAPPRTIYNAFVDPAALVSWLPPKGMKGHVYEYDPREGGAYRMSLTYVDADHHTPGKTAEHVDIVQGRFLQLVPDERIVQLVQFESDDLAFAGEMTMTWSFVPVAGGTEVTIICENVPEGIRQEDHDAGLRASLDNLAAFTE